MAYKAETGAVQKNEKTAEGAIPFGFEQQPPTAAGLSNVYDETDDFSEVGQSEVETDDVDPPGGQADCVPELLAAGPETQKPDAHEGPVKSGGYVLGSGRPD